MFSALCKYFVLPSTLHYHTLHSTVYLQGTMPQVFQVILHRRDPRHFFIITIIILTLVHFATIAQCPDVKPVELATRSRKYNESA